MASPSQIPRRRNRPAGQPDPTAEVIALSPKSLLEIHPYTCYVCNKGFARLQNMQCHLRKHKVQASLHRGSNNGNRKKVYVCPELTCIYHHPSRALSDITGIKKHFCRKHSNIKNWKCDRCSRMYAVEADLKAHLKKCQGNVKRRGIGEDGREGSLRLSDGGSSSYQPMPPILCPFPSPCSPIISTENSGPSRNINEFLTIPSFSNELTFTSILSLTNSDEIEKVYNESVFGVMEMHSGRQMPQALSMNPTMAPYSTLNPEFNTMVGTPAGEMVKGATIQPEIGELSHDHMLASMEEAMGLKGISSTSYGVSLASYDDFWIIN